MTASPRPIRVLIVEDTAVVRLLLEEIVGSDPRLEVAASVGDGEEALRILPKIAPDVISMDIRLPGMNGFEATQRIMSEHPTPIVVVSASVESDDLRISMNALRAGALSIVEKPVGISHEEYRAIAARLCNQLVLMSDVKVVRQRKGRPVGMSARATPSEPSRAPQLPVDPDRRFTMLGIVASTGGPNAVVTVLQGLTPGFALPIALVQHITPSFLDGFVAWLADASGFDVRIVRSGERMRSGAVYVAPAESHLEIHGAYAESASGPKVDGQRPSGTVLFESMAETVAPHALGVLLTGMGEDGAVGLRALRRAGGHTIAEDQSTAVVYGMPRAAARLGAVDDQLPLPQIAPRLRSLTAHARLVS